MFTQWKLIAGLAIIAALGGMLWHDHWMTKRYNAKAAEVRTVTATLEQERKAREIEQADKRKADETAKSLQAELDRIAAAPKPVSVFCKPARLSSSSESGAATVANDPAAGSGAEEALRDIGAALADVWREHQSNAARQIALQEWERARTH